MCSPRADIIEADQQVDVNKKYVQSRDRTWDRLRVRQT